MTGFFPSDLVALRTIWLHYARFGCTMHDPIGLCTIRFYYFTLLVRFYEY